MNDQGSVNGQIVDSVADVLTLASGMAPPQAFGMLDTVMTDTLGMAMYNATSRQQGASMIGSAATTSSCAKMLSAPFASPTPPPPVPEPPPVTPLVDIAAWTGVAWDAIAYLQRVKGPSVEALMARAGLHQLELAALAPSPVVSPSAPPSPPPPPPPPPGPIPTLASIAAETGIAWGAIDYLQMQAGGATFDARMARAGLDQLALEAAPRRRTSPSSSSPPSPSSPPSSQRQRRGGSPGAR